MATEVTYQHVSGRQPGVHEEELVRATLDTGSGGASSSTLSVSLDGDYGAEPVVSADCIGDGADVNLSNKTTEGFDVAIANGPASTTVTVELIVRGEHGVS